MTTSGQYRGIFAQGIRSIRMTFAEGFVYVSKNIRNEIVIFNVDGRKILDGRQEALEYDEAWH